MVYSLYSGFPYRKVYSPTLPPLGSWAQMAVGSGRWHTSWSAFHTFPQLHLLTPVFARDAAGERQSVRLGHHLIPPDGFVMAAPPQRAESLVVPSPRALGGGERSGSGAARHLNVDRELSGVVVELDRASCSSGEL